MEKNYYPKPIETANVNLPDCLSPLLEKMAENTHDLWAKNRMAEGWKYGPVRDDAKKTNPCLVPYSELPEKEKEYDRKTSVEALKFILHEGYSIHRL